MAVVRTKDNVHLYLKEWGEGSPVILLHGWPLSADTFDDLGIALAESGYRGIAYDRRGFGRSEQPPRGYEYDTLADDLASVVQYAGSSAALVGFSMGGGEVARYMSRHRGANVTKAVLAASVVPYLIKTDDNPDGVEPTVFQDMARKLKEDRAAFWPAFFQDFYGLGVLSQPVSDEIVDWSCALAMQAGLLATLQCAKAFATTDFRGDLAAFTVPTLILHGTEDKTVPIATSARKAAAGIRDSNLVEYEGSPHGLFASDKERFIDDVVGFLRGR
jgi:pimeloyl-ACP methyl ester carboxylesterase